MASKQEASVEEPTRSTESVSDADTHIDDSGENVARITSDAKPTVSTSPTRLRRILTILNWMPPWCRYDPKNPPKFSVFHNLLFAFAGAFTVANLYYNHPILNILAHDFDVPYITVSRIPTLLQAGYTVGLFFLCPLGDIFKRRQFTLTLVFFTATMWIGLCTTNNFDVFCAISFITAVTTVTPQIMLPLVGDLAPPSKRPLALSIVVSGNLLGIVIARILSGVVTNFTSWRNIYWIALVLQLLICALLWLFMPDYPSTNPNGINYFKVLWSMLALCAKHPVLVQAGLISYCTSCAYMGFWTTLTFLLSSEPFNLPPVSIGLLGLIGLCGIFMGPVYAKYLVQPYEPLFASIIAESVNLAGLLVGTYTGTFTVAGPIIQAFTLDAGLQISQVANRSSIYGVAPNARNRVNTAFMLFTFFGQLTGTSVNNKLYEMGGWRASGSFSVGVVAMVFVVCLARGPHEPGWVGWTGGWNIRKKNTPPAPPTALPNAGDPATGEVVPEEKISEKDGADKV